MSEEAPAVSVNRLVVPAVSVVALVVSLFSGYLYLENKFDEAGTERQAIRDKIVANSNNDRREFDRLDNDLRALSRDRVYRAEVELWVERLKSANPTLTIPPLPPSHN